MSLLKDKIGQEKQENISKLIETIRQHSQNDQIDNLKSSLETLKIAMKEMVDSKASSESNSDPMSNLNDL